ncbi:hypothetical protein HNR12_005652 [Streptomonospora nanhaiensis]|uniref:Uncharacterized protein n=1 Tax=Streptomonospora nanhaiensis TaxID=1323731 RepID=A0A853BVI5_9ACTN|nr:hypothetical protein [Streptomonospora nanhaiensis]NYI99298.1 hypothetical protein [Streptomonospora nanhaiensis]
MIRLITRRRLAAMEEELAQARRAAQVARSEAARPTRRAGSLTPGDRVLVSGRVLVVGEVTGSPMGTAVHVRGRLEETGAPWSTVLVSDELVEVAEHQDLVQPPTGYTANEVVAGDVLLFSGHELTVTAVERRGGSVRIQGRLEDDAPWVAVLAGDAPVEVVR